VLKRSFSESFAGLKRQMGSNQRQQPLHPEIEEAQTMEEVQVSNWHHAPKHYFVPNTLYMVTAATLHKRRLFNSYEKLKILEEALFDSAQMYGWELHAWALFPNHYHVVLRSPQNGISLKRLIQRLHSRTALAINTLDKTPTRRVWYEYWDTCLTYEKSYLARLNYVNNNPVRHGLVSQAEDYPFCSAAWFKAHAPAELQRRLACVPCDRVSVPEVDL
jgi:putative transposase